MQGHSRAAIQAVPEGVGPRQYAKYVCDPGQRGVFRDARYSLRADVGALAGWFRRHEGCEPSWGRTASCGRCLGAAVELRCTCTGGVYPCSIETCAYVWGCAVCAEKIRTRRALEVVSGAAAWVAGGGTLAMLTLTVRHHEWMKLARVLGAVSGSWRKLQNRKEYRAFRLLIDGTVKALEVKVGDNGWHPHIHLLVFVRPGVDFDTVAAAASALYDPWEQMVTKELGVSPTREHGIDFRPMGADAAGYVSKIGFEIAASDTKGGRDFFALLPDARNGEVESFARCLEFLDTMRGRHSLDWSPGLRGRLGLGAEKSDEELALEDEGGELCELVERSVWNAALLKRNESGVPVVTEILRSAEDRVRNGRFGNA